MKSKRIITSSIKFCIYCGSKKNVTDDHIPPKTLFSKPRPSNLITIPSCQLCNSGASKDDEYFRDMLIMREDLYNHPVVQKNLEVVYRSFTYPNKKRYTDTLFSRMDLVDRFTEVGLYIGKYPIINIDLPRIRKVVNRIVRGLFYYELNRVLPFDFNVTTITAEDMNHTNMSAQAKLLRAFCIPLLYVKPKTIGNNVFAYKYKVAADNGFVSAWALLFYGKVLFFCSTLPK